MQVESKLVRSKKMLCEEVFIKSNRIQCTKEYVLPIYVNRVLHQSNDVQVVSAVVVQ